MIADQFPDLLKLSDQEKLTLADELTQMVVGRQAEELQSVVQECLEEYRANPNEVVSWEEAKASLRRLRGNG